MKLSGKWVGHYRQGDDEVPIEVNLDQVGDRIQGTMSEPATEREYSVSSVALRDGWPPGEDELLVKTLREQFPESGNAPIRVYLKMPSDSQLSGRVLGSRVEFQKTYLGTCTSGYLVGKERLLSENPGHVVSYLGHLSPGNDRIEGRWTINSGSGKTLLGSFELWRGGQVTT